MLDKLESPAQEMLSVGMILIGRIVKVHLNFVDRVSMDLNLRGLHSVGLFDHQFHLVVELVQTSHVQLNVSLVGVVLRLQKPDKCLEQGDDVLGVMIL